MRSPFRIFLHFEEEVGNSLKLAGLIVAIIVKFVNEIGESSGSQ
jgi:hypothetical protein